MDKKQSSQTDHAPDGCFVCQMAIPFLRDLWPKGAREHFRASRVEFLKGVRSLIDERIDRLSAKQEQKGQRVTVE